MSLWPVGGVRCCAVIWPEACELVNVVAPEHVELLVADPWALLSQVRHAGAIFLGAASAEPIGDYVAGPNHILPTNGTARFASALGVDDFVKRSNIIAYTEAALAQLGARGGTPG